MVYYYITLSKKYTLEGRLWMDVIVEKVKNGSTVETSCFRSTYQTIYKYKSDFIKNYRVSKKQVKVTRAKLEEAF